MINYTSTLQKKLILDPLLETSRKIYKKKKYINPSQLSFFDLKDEAF